MTSPFKWSHRWDLMHPAGKNKGGSREIWDVQAGRIHEARQPFLLLFILVLSVFSLKIKYY